MHRSDIHACTQAGRNPKSAGKNGGGRVRTEREKRAGKEGGRRSPGARAESVHVSTEHVMFRKKGNNIKLQERLC